MLFGQTIRQLINASDEELNKLLSFCFEKNFKPKDFLSERGKTAEEIFFINTGLIRVMVIDREGVEHTTHFALEGQFIADYSSFLTRQPALYALQALESTTAIVMPRKAVEWGYSNLTQGQKLGRLIAEYYFVYLDTRIQHQYALTPKERYDRITEIFPNIHNRVPQHMIASYLGITSVHLSRLKKTHR